MKPMIARTCLLAALAASAAGCIVTERTEHVLYLEPDGAVTWTVIEHELRSDADEPAARRQEEADYLAAVAAGTQPIADSLRRLGGRSLVSYLARDRRPYTTWTEARFDSVAELADALLAELGVPGGAVLTHEGDLHRLEVELWLPDETASVEDDGDDVFLPLADAVEDHRLVLTAGSFVEARGFHLEDDGRAAVVEKLSDEEIEAAGGRIVLSLAWSTDGA